MHSTIISRVLRLMGVRRPQEHFLIELLMSWLTVQGRFNFTNVCRYCRYNERTLRRWFSRCFNWAEFNSRLIQMLAGSDHEMIAAMDASFVCKSGKKTEGIDWYWHGTASRAEKGLEASVISLVDMDVNSAYALSAKQTNPTGTPASKTGSGLTRIDQGVDHLQETHPFFPAKVKYLAVDGNYAGKKFVDGACDLGLEVIGHLRNDADANYLYQGEQKGRGRRRKYDGKVDWHNLDKSRWQEEGEIRKGIQVRTAVVYHKSLKRKIKITMLYQTKDESRYALLFSTDLDLSGQDIVRYYRARFQIEFLFRDAKQSMGFNHCQARDSKKTQFHWNIVMAALNLAKLQAAKHQPKRFSLATYKQQCSNQHLIKMFSDKLGIDWSYIKSHPAFPALCNYGAIAP
jgi:Transposase DDE domain